MRIRAVIAVVSALVVTGCADDSARSASESNRGGTIAAVDPVDGAPLRFTAEDLPEAWEISNVEDGYADPIWSSDTVGGAHPTVVLVPEDWRDIDDARWVIIESYDARGNEMGDVSQELPRDSRVNGLKTGVVGGRPATWNDASIQDGTTFVAVDTSSPANADFGSGPFGFIVRGAAFHSAADLKVFAEAVTDAPEHEPVTLKAPPGWRTLASIDGAHTQFRHFKPALGTRRVQLMGSISGEARELYVMAFEGDTDAATAMAIQRFTTGIGSTGQPRLGKRDGVEWYASPDSTSVIVSTLGGHPLALADLPQEADEPLIADILRSLRIVDEVEWNDALRTWAPDLGEPRPGDVVVLSRDEDGFAWALHANDPKSAAGDDYAGVLDGATVVANRNSSAPERSGLEAGIKVGGVSIWQAILNNERRYVFVVAAPPGVDKIRIGNEQTIELQAFGGSMVGAGLGFWGTTGTDDVGKVGVTIFGADRELVCAFDGAALPADSSHPGEPPGGECAIEQLPPTPESDSGPTTSILVGTTVKAG